MKIKIKFSLIFSYDFVVYARQEHCYIVIIYKNEMQDKYLFLKFESIMINLEGLKGAGGVLNLRMVKFDFLCVYNRGTS